MFKERKVISHLTLMMTTIVATYMTTNIAGGLYIKVDKMLDDSKSKQHSMVNAFGGMLNEMMGLTLDRFAGVSDKSNDIKTLINRNIDYLNNVCIPFQRELKVAYDNLLAVSSKNIELYPDVDGIKKSIYMLRIDDELYMNIELFKLTLMKNLPLDVQKNVYELEKDSEEDILQSRQNQFSRTV